jgi:hypothetical protein
MKSARESRNRFAAISSGAHPLRSGAPGVERMVREPTWHP